MRWNNQSQIGEQPPLPVQLTESLGGYTTQEFTLEVTGINAPPAIVSNSVTRDSLKSTPTPTLSFALYAIRRTMHSVSIWAKRHLA
ncbi:hypothetical protein AB0758_45105 [Tolypothrix bouteillei VB521301_2]|uniref:hypothetical protein n=1 Tax=Tolypothrix bouteillei TaxID=1246981 RepID=UPI0038B45F2C